MSSPSICAARAPRHPRSTVYNIFRKFQRDGVWEAIWAELHIALREQMGREASPSVAVLDSQSVKSAEEGAAETTRGLRRRQASEGSKIHALVDSKGLPMQAVVHSAAIQDRDGAGLVLDSIRRRFPRLELIWADGGYNAWQVDAAVAKGATAAPGDRQTEQRHKGLRRPAAPLGGRAHLLLVRTKPAARQGLREPC